MNISQMVACGLQLLRGHNPNFTMQPTFGHGGKGNMRNLDVLVPIRRCKAAFDNSEEVMFEFKNPDIQPIYVTGIIVDVPLASGTVKVMDGAEEVFNAKFEKGGYFGGELEEVIRLGGQGSGDSLVIIGPKPPGYTKLQIEKAEADGIELEPKEPNFHGTAYILYMPA